MRKIILDVDPAETIRQGLGEPPRQMGSSRQDTTAAATAERMNRQRLSQDYLDRVGMSKHERMAAGLPEPVQSSGSVVRSVGERLGSQLLTCGSVFVILALLIWAVEKFIF